MLRLSQPQAHCAGAGETSLIARGCGEGYLDAGDGHAAFADSGSATFHRAGPDIARGKNAGKAGLKRTRSTFARFPGGRIRHVGSRFDKSLFVPLDLARQPFGARIGANHGKNRDDPVPFLNGRKRLDRVLVFLPGLSLPLLDGGQPFDYLAFASYHGLFGKALGQGLSVPAVLRGYR
jgi:hypothetical protein